MEQEGVALADRRPPRIARRGGVGHREMIDAGRHRELAPEVGIIERAYHQFRIAHCALPYSPALRELVTKYLDLRCNHGSRVTVRPQGGDQLRAGFPIQALDDETLAVAPGGGLLLERFRGPDRRERIRHDAVDLRQRSGWEGSVAGKILLHLLGAARSLQYDTYARLCAESSELERRQLYVESVSTRT